MKRIHFDHIKHWIWTAILILSVVFVLIGTFEFFEFENSKFHKSLSAIGFFLQVIYFSKMFWYKNYMHWNKKGAVIRINSWIGTSFSFNQIKTTELHEKQLIIAKKNGNCMTFDLNGILASDTQKLHEIIVKNTMISTP